MGGWLRRATALTIVLSFALLAAGTAAAGPPQPAPEAWVSVRLSEPGHARSVTEDASLEELGYRTLPVPTGMTQEAFIAWLREQPGVESPRPDATVTAAALPDDPFYPSAQSGYLETIGAPGGWDLATGSDTIVVAVLDSGIDLAHPDLGGQLWQNPLDADGDGIDDDGNGCIDDRYGCRFIQLSPQRQAECGYADSIPTGAVQDDNGGANHSHGTIVASIVGAAGNNATGITGVAWNVRLMTVKVLDCGTSLGAGRPSGDMSQVARGIDYARRMGADVINLSLASTPGDPAADLPELRDAIAAAEAAGIIIVAAAGNHGADGPGLPAAYTEYENVVGVGASNGLEWATYSAYGDGVDYAAPGSDIAGATRTDLGGTPYGSDTGTSYATPLVTGMFALLKSRNSRMTMEDYLAIAAAAATPAPAAPHGGNWAGHGIANIAGALARVPMTVTGGALHDWMDVEPGTSVRAFIGAVECGTTQSEAFGPLARYAIRVLAAAEKAGCGAPGATVELRVGGAPAQPAFAWGAQNADLALINRDISSVSPPPGAIVVQTLGTGWSLATHLIDTGSMPGAVSYLPTNWTQIRRWNAAADGGAGAMERYARTAPAYAQTYEIARQFDVFWVDGASANIAQPNPNAPVRSLGLQPGWNAFLYTGTSRSVEDALADVEGKYEQVLQYENGTGLWLAHIPGRTRALNDFGGLFTLEVYWVYMTEPGVLTMD